MITISGKPVKALLAVASVALGAGAATIQSAPTQSATLFQSTVGPLLQKRCVVCHNTRDKSGGLDLSTELTARTGGVHGVVLKPGDSGGSLLYQRVASRQMPPTNPLSASEVAALKQWTDSGAVWKSSAQPLTHLATKRAGPDWWSLRKPRLPTVPPVKDRSWVRNPIDAFVLANLEQHGLHHAASADRITLIRRIFYDMLGVQPSPAEIDAFLRDSTLIAYDRLVDRVLADPRYGEHWGRHWLDVARFSESNGFERDAIREHAWPYRDYVINSLNADKPYDQFVREQIAGDVLPNATAESIAATGFLVAGPFDDAAASAASAVLRAQIREEELEDMLGTVGQTFLGLTVNCARCHDHKFDPILQRDYYRLKAVFEGVHGGDRPFPATQEDAARSAGQLRLREQADVLSEQIRLIEAGARTKSDLWEVQDVPLPLARWSFVADARDGVGSLHGTLHGGASIANGSLHLNGRDAYVETAPVRRDLRAKSFEAWVNLPNRDQRGGAVLSIQTPDGAMFDGLVYGERQPRKWTAGSSLFERTKDLAAPAEDAPADALIHIAVTFDWNNKIALYRNGVRYGAAYIPDGQNGSLRTFKSGEGRILLGLRHSGAGSGFLEGEIHEARLYDRALTPAQLFASFRAGMRKREPLSSKPLTADQSLRLSELNSELHRIESSLNTSVPVSSGYAARPLQPGPTYLLLRGDVLAHGDLMGAGGLSALGTTDFGLRPEAPEAERRLRLADWIVRPESALTARVMVNRVWHYHFGRGIVGTPNDFGFNGEVPTHPDLLDWLAYVFAQREGDRSLKAASPHEIEKPQSGVEGPMAYRLKSLHRLILLSNTYRQSSTHNAKAAAIDAEDRWLWRFAPRRLEGEAIRDSMLVASGRIDWSRGGPGFRPFVETVNNSHFYAVFDKDGAGFNRRTVYRINVNSARSALLDSLDCPDPSTKTPRRGVTTTPLQALELMNNRFVLEQSKFFGQRVRSEAGADAAQQADRAYWLALGRRPSPIERIRAASLISAGSADTLCWALFNSSEFLMLR